MDSPKYLIIITLLDGQNFTLPEGAPDKVEAHVFAEARFGSESYLKSDAVNLTNSNPEFVTELAWQVDKKSLHQLKVERRAIKLQVFVQTRAKKKNLLSRNRQSDSNPTNGVHSNETNGESHKVELIGYTIIDIRSAQETDKPKFQWLPLLNPKFKKPSYNRPEVQLALTLHKVEEVSGDHDSDSIPSCSFTTDGNSDILDDTVKTMVPDVDSPRQSMDTTLDNQHYKTCLDFTLDSDQLQSDEIIENDIRIRSIDGLFYIYDVEDNQKSTIEDCKEHYVVTVTIPFNSDLDLVLKEPIKEGRYFFSINLLGSTKNTDFFRELTCLDIKEVEFHIQTTELRILAKYFELNSNLVIKLHDTDNQPIGMAIVQLDQLCSTDTKRRSIEGIFAIQSMSDHETQSPIHPSIGVSVVLDKVEEDSINLGENKQMMESSRNTLVTDDHAEMVKQHFGDILNSINDTHQLTYDSNLLSDTNSLDEEKNSLPEQEDHHYCFTIDLKEFTYTQNQRLIPTLRELVVRYSYPFFGYQDTITTDASVPINANSSIIVSGYCEFNFATTFEPLLTALKEIPLNLDILTCDENRLKELTGITNHRDDERLVATCSLNLADVMCLNADSSRILKEKAICMTASVPIYALDGGEIGNLQLYLCLLDRGKPSFEFKASVDNLNEQSLAGIKYAKTLKNIDNQLPTNSQKLEAFIDEAKVNFDSWKEDFSRKLSEDIRKRENERFKRLHQRLEAKDAHREYEFKKKMDELGSLEMRFRKSLACVETLEKTLNANFEQMKTKDALFDSRLETLDLKISQAVSNIKLEYDRKLNSIPVLRPQRSLDESQLVENKASSARAAPLPSKTVPDLNGHRRTILKTNYNNIAGNIPVPVRGSSLVRAGVSSDGPATRLVKRPVGMVTTVVNGMSSRNSRPGVSRLALSKETQEKLVSLRKEKAELLKRGCKPNDELIQEINSLIEKLVC